MLARTELPPRTDKPLRAAISRKSAAPFSSPRVLSRLQYHSPLFASTPSMPLHLGSSRSAQRFGRSSLLTAWVLYACTKTLMNCGAQPRCAGRVPSSISLCHLEMLEGTLPAHRGWAPQFINVFVQAYNTHAVKSEDLPKRWADLLEPRWRGMLGVEAKSGEWYCSLLKTLGEEKGAALFREIAARNGLSVLGGNSVLANMVVSGEVPLARAVYSHMLEQATQQGAPVDWFAIDPMIARANGIGVSRKPPHQNDALLFYEYAIGDAQPLM